MKQDILGGVLILLVVFAFAMMVLSQVAHVIGWTITVANLVGWPVVWWLLEMRRQRCE